MSLGWGGKRELGIAAADKERIVSSELFSTLLYPRTHLCVCHQWQPSPQIRQCVSKEEEEEDAEEE